MSPRALNGAVVLSTQPVTCAVRECVRGRFNIKVCIALQLPKETNTYLNLVPQQVTSRLQGLSNKLFAPTHQSSVSSRQTRRYLYSGLKRVYKYFNKVW
jgi:hypothetical protein